MTTIYWKRCKTYDEAKDHTGVVYLHEWNGIPIYWGKAHNSTFGGNPRKVDGVKKNPRYNTGYRHWIDGCLRYGARLYIGKPEGGENLSIDEIESSLIAAFPTEFNGHNDEPSIELIHKGEIPETIRVSLIDE